MKSIFLHRDFVKTFLFLSGKIHLMRESKILTEMEMFFTALADKTRLRLLNLVRYEEICVCFFVEALNESQPKISRHLAYLRKAGLVSSRREGKWMHYKILFPENPYLSVILENTLNSLESQRDMQEDYERMVDARCSIEASSNITRL